MYYYLVSVGVHRHWKTDTFTYHYETLLSAGTLVIVPFGAHKKIGTVVNIVSKPTIETRSIQATLLDIVPENFLQFKAWFQQYYLLNEQEAQSHFFPNYISLQLAEKKQSNDIVGKNKQTPHPLTLEQKNAYKAITATKKISVLHGVTGSGKTRVYQELIRDSVARGESVLLLYPEIALTGQLLTQLKSTFPTVLVGHSQLSSKERSILWNTVAKQDEPSIVIGPRSSLFLPFHNLGLVIIDEFHEPSYKQESGVRYNTVQVAAGLSNAHKAKLVLGSATPPISETKHILDKGGQLVCMHTPAISSDHKVSSVIIPLQDRSKFIKSPMISTRLIEAIEEALHNNEQSLLFLNRRGTAKKLLCESCGWTAECPHCDIPLTYHQDSYRLQCHSCSYNVAPLGICPVCGTKTETRVPGSKALSSELQKIFPHAVIGRFDSDTNKAEQFHSNFSNIQSGDIDIIVGTQQIIKGVDLPLLSVVGVLDADTSLYFPDYSSDERTFQLLAQVRGRIGRGHRAGTLVVQTRQPESSLLSQAIAGDWHTFFEQELKHREQFHFPPYRFMAKVIVRSKNPRQLERLTKICMQHLSGKERIKVRGPVLPMRHRVGGVSIQHILVETSKRSVLQEALGNLPKEVIVDLDPIHLL